jgi:hypothetical protein
MLDLLDTNVIDPFAEDPTYTWTSTEQYRSRADGSILERRFSELSLSTQLSLGLVTGTPPGYQVSLTNPQYFYYTLTNPLTETVSIGYRYAPGAQAYNNFWGWRQLVNYYYKNSIYADLLVNEYVWQLRSLPSSGGTPQDLLYQFNGAGQVVSSQTTSTDSLTLNLGQTWGVRLMMTRADLATVSVMSASSNGSTIATVPMALRYDVPAPPLANPAFSSDLLIKAATPTLLTYPYLKIQLSITRPYISSGGSGGSGGSGSGTATIQAVDELRIFTYGVYNSMNVPLYDLQDNGWITHPTGTSDVARLKPPGKAYLSDTYNTPAQTFTANAMWR